MKEQSIFILIIAFVYSLLCFTFKAPISLYITVISILCAAYGISMFNHKEDRKKNENRQEDGR